MSNKLMSGIVASSLMGTSLLFATPAQAYMCLDLTTYRYVEVSDSTACRAYNSVGEFATPQNPVYEEEDVYTSPTPTDAPAEPVVDVETILEDDPGGQDVVVETADGERLVGEVTTEEKEDLLEMGATVEVDTPVSVNYSWGIDRVNQPALPLDNYADFAGKGSGVEIYIIDTGVDYNHSNFKNISRTGFDYIGGDRWSDGRYQIIDGDPMDCHGHGTHVAGTAASIDYGIAPEATIIGVRVLSCSGSGSTGGVITGVDWVTEQKELRPDVPMVINMSLGGSTNSVLNSAVADAVDAGIIVVVAGGNSTEDVRWSSPASEDKAITVGSTTTNDSISYFSNYGPGVDIFAPGSSIKSTTYGGGTGTMSGTSMASPHVAGIAAGYLADGGTASGFDAWLDTNSVDKVIHSRSGTTTRLAQYNVATDPNPEPEPEPTPTPTPTPTPPPAQSQPAPPPSSGGGGGSAPAPAPAPAPEPIVEVPPVYVPPTVENPITIQEEPEVVERKAVAQKRGKSVSIAVTIEGTDYTSIRIYKWNKKKKKWKQIRYTLVTLDNNYNFSIPSKKHGRYLIVGYDVIADEAEEINQFRIYKKGRNVAMLPK